MKMLFLFHWTICWKTFLIKRFFEIKNSFTFVKLKEIEIETKNQGLETDKV